MGVVVSVNGLLSAEQRADTPGRQADDLRGGETEVTSQGAQKHQDSADL